MSCPSSHLFATDIFWRFVIILSKINLLSVKLFLSIVYCSYVLLWLCVCVVLRCVHCTVMCAVCLCVCWWPMYGGSSQQWATTERDNQISIIIYLLILILPSSSFWVHLNGNLSIVHACHQLLIAICMKNPLRVLNLLQDCNSWPSFRSSDWRQILTYCRRCKGEDRFLAR